MYDHKLFAYDDGEPLGSDDLDRIVRAKWVQPLVLPTDQDASPEYSRNVSPREEIVDRVVDLLLPDLGLGEKSVEAEQLRQLLIDRPDINSVDQLRTYLADLTVPSKHQTPEIKDIARRLESVVQSSKHWREKRLR
ncbi:hypothetical protein [Mycolicibacterium mageritense]|uniref:hypothetical protein n=1 Tax=Mycolicibacterium mageritense TaxID=53462 RepID=UPI0011D5A90A|nr:hypothetical protein [Mycolicibacterium mageritense]TXI65315.1 MAG: hypothetical protein E6Q55_02590 [Mycolicibacterium mageritense]